MSHAPSAGGSTPAAAPVAPRLAAGPFVRHYVEMVVAMFAGMVPFGILFVSPLDPLGYRDALSAHPYVRELLMLVAMSIPMAAWMLYRRHSVERTAEMVVGMALPAIAVVALVATEAVSTFTVTTLTFWSHAAMLLGMLAAMLLRRTEYAMPHSAHHHNGPHATHEGHATHGGD